MSYIEETDQNNIILEEGDYNFTVTDIEHERFPGGPKIPACYKFTITMQVITDGGIVDIQNDLILYKPFEWRVLSFFRCIGHKTSGYQFLFDRTTIVGSRGRAHFKPRSYKDRNGEDRVTNDVARFYNWGEETLPDVT